MAERAERFRRRAKECRERAECADYAMQQFPTQVADDLEEEADKMDGEETKEQD